MNYTFPQYTILSFRQCVSPNKIKLLLDRIDRGCGSKLTDILQKAKLQKRLTQLKLSADEVTVVAKRLMTLVVIEAILIPELRDPKDQMVIATAIAGDAQIIISGDRDLLVLHPFSNIAILSPQEFLSHYFSDIRS